MDYRLQQLEGAYGIISMSTVCTITLYILEAWIGKIIKLIKNKTKQNKNVVQHTEDHHFRQFGSGKGKKLVLV